MNLVKVVLGVVLAALTLPSIARAAEWTTDYEKALAEAKKSNKLVLADFTGSDWCGWCKLLKKEVFDTDEFKAWADKNVVLLELDFPRTIKLPADLKAQNDKLNTKFGIRGYPTILFMDADGNEVGRNGYFDGGPADWIKDAELSMLDKNPAIRPLTSLTAGLAQAKAESKALLLIVDNKGDAKVGDLLKDAALAKFAQVRLVVVRLTGKMDDTNANALVDFNKKYALKAGDLVNLVLADQDKPLATWDKVPAADELLKSARAKLPALAYDGGWLEDYPKAVELAAQLKRALVLDFTVAEKPECAKLEKDVLAADAFKTYAKDNLVLVKFEFSRKATPKPGAISRHYGRALAGQLALSDVPTLAVIAPDGKQLGKIEQAPETADALVAELKKLAPATDKGKDAPK